MQTCLPVFTWAFVDRTQRFLIDPSKCPKGLLLDPIDRNGRA
jgi:hypothetical protein